MAADSFTSKSAGVTTSGEAVSAKQLTKQWAEANERHYEKSPGYKSYLALLQKMADEVRFARLAYTPKAPAAIWSDWTPITLLPGYITIPGCYDPAFMRDEAGWVHLRGAFQPDPDYSGPSSGNLVISDPTCWPQEFGYHTGAPFVYAPVIQPNGELIGPGGPMLLDSIRYWTPPPS